MGPVSGIPTLKDVALRAGVSQVAVSAVLRGDTRNTRVSPQTRERILDAASELGYRPNAVARRLRGGRSGVLGFYSGYGYEAIAGAFYWDILAGIQRACDQHSTDLLLLGSFRSADTEAVRAAFADSRIDGLIHFGPPDDVVAALDPRVLGPVVSIGEPHANFPSFCTDGFEGMERVVEHLASRGRRRLAFKQRTATHQAANERADGFLVACAARGLEVVPTTDGEDGDISQDLAAWGARPPDAVVCWRDVVAWRVIVQLEAAGLRVPDDVAVTGFDHVHNVAEPRLNLTTVNPRWDAVAEAAARTVLTENHAIAPRRTDFSPTLVVGNTS